GFGESCRTSRRLLGRASRRLPARGRVAAPASAVPTRSIRRVRPSGLEDDQLPLRRRQEFAAVLRHDDILFEVHAPVTRHADADLQRVDLALLDPTVGPLAVALPAWSQQRAAVVAGAPQLMAQRELPLLHALALEDLARHGVDFPALNARLDSRRGALDRLIDDLEVAHYLGRRLALARPKHVVGALHVGAVLVLVHTEIDRNQLPRLHRNLRWPHVSNRRIRPHGHRRAIVPVPRRVDAALFELAVHEVADVLLGDARADEALRRLPDALGRLDRLADARQLGR